MMRVQFLSTIALGALTASCASPVETRRLEAVNDRNPVGEGVSYYLPKRDVKLIIERQPTTPGLERAEAAFARARALEYAAQTELSAKTEAAETADRAVAAAKALEAPEATLNPLIAAARTARLAAGEADFLHKRLKADADRKADAYKSELKSALDGSPTRLRETARIEVLPFSPDPDYRFAARLNHGPHRDDSWKIATTSSGLLSTVDVDPSGKLDEIAVSIGKLVVSHFAPVSSIADVKSIEGLRSGDRNASGPCPTEFYFEKVFDPAKFDSSDPANVESHRGTIAKALANLCSSYRLDVAAPTQAKNGPDDSSLYKRGFAYRRTLPFTIVFEKAVTATVNGREVLVGFEPFKSEVVMLPNGAPIDVLPFEASGTTARNLAAVFDHGMLTSIDFQHPSEGQAIVAIPFEIVTGAAQHLGELATLRTSVTQKRVNAAGEETRLLEEFQKTLKARQDYDKALKAYIAGDDVPESE